MNKCGPPPAGPLPQHASLLWDRTRPALPAHKDLMPPPEVPGREKILLEKAGGRKRSVCHATRALLCGGA